MTSPTTPHSPTTKDDLSDDEIEMRERWANEIIDKQYRLYTWNDGKLQALATINGLLVAAIGFLFKEGPENWIALVALLTALGFLFASMIICLWRLRNFPQSGRTRGDWPNLRSINGIQSFEKWEEYRDAFRSNTRSQFLDDSVRQIYGMAYNNRTGHLMMEVAVLFTLLGTAALAIATAALFLMPVDASFHLPQSASVTNNAISLPPNGGDAHPGKAGAKTTAVGIIGGVAYP